MEEGSSDKAHRLMVALVGLRRHPPTQKLAKPFPVRSSVVIVHTQFEATSARKILVDLL